MKRLIVAMMTMAVVVPSVAVARDQTKVIPGETKTVTATVESIEKATRSLTLKGPEGNYVTMTVPQSATRFDALKVGDVLTATYYESLILRLKAPGEAAVDTDAAKVTPSTGGTRPGGTAATQRTITATITAIDPNVPSITFTGPNNWKYSSRVEDTKALSKVKVGDRVDITWTEALLVSFADEKK
jgi:hypothetical protein